MQRLVCAAPALSAALAAFFVPAPGATAQYVAGFEWNRAADWLAGSEHGALVNNPGPDSAGSPVWAYEVAKGGGLGSSDPWYAQPTVAMTWDSAWWDSGHGAWSLGDDVNPPISADRMTHNLGVLNHGNMPLVRWTNPVGDGALVKIGGSLITMWTGDGFVGAPTDVDLVIGLFDASESSVSIIYQATLSKPLAFLSVGDSVESVLDLAPVALDSGDSVLVTLRAQDVLPGRWVALHDSGLTLTLVPGPGSAAILGLGALIAARRCPRYRFSAPE